MARIIPLPLDRRHHVLPLLPWYVTGRLEPADQARVDAHLAECAACRAELDEERRLEAEVAGLSLDVEQGWARMRRRIDRTGVGGGLLDSPWIRRIRAWVRSPAWALAAPLVVVATLSAVLVAYPRPTRYVGLSEVPRRPTGDAMVVFRPQTSEAALRRALTAAGVRVVDGPTEAGAWVLDAPPAALASLRRDPDVLMAEPIETGASQ